MDLHLSPWGNSKLRSDNVTVLCQVFSCFLSIIYCCYLFAARCVWMLLGHGRSLCDWCLAWIGKWDGWWDLTVEFRFETKFYSFFSINLLLINGDAFVCRGIISRSSTVLRVWWLSTSTKSGRLVMRSSIWTQNLLRIASAVDMEKRLVPRLVFIDITILQWCCSSWGKNIWWCSEQFLYFHRLTSMLDMFCFEASTLWFTDICVLF